MAVQRRGQPPDRADRVPDFVDDPDKDARTGLHHTAFEYAGFEELNASYLRLQGGRDRARRSASTTA